ncbi:MAG: hypothetical protein ACTSXL_06005, partial [Alphaproteobacteria bacterium]
FIAQVQLSDEFTSEATPDLEIEIAKRVNNYISDNVLDAELADLEIISRTMKKGGIVGDTSASEYINKNKSKVKKEDTKKVEFILSNIGINILFFTSKLKGGNTETFEGKIASLEFEDAKNIANDFEKEYFDLFAEYAIAEYKKIAKERGLSFSKGGTIGKYTGFDNINISVLPKAVQNDIRTVKAVAEGNIEKIKTDTAEIQAQLAKIETEPSDAEIAELTEKAKQHLLNKIKKEHPKAIKKTVETTHGVSKPKPKKTELQAKIKGYETAVKYAKGNNKTNLEAKIKGYKTALKYTK